MTVLGFRAPTPQKASWGLCKCEIWGVENSARVLTQVSERIVLEQKNLAWFLCQHFETFIQVLVHLTWKQHEGSGAEHGPRLGQAP